jgi:hypothetical protein
MLFSVVMVHAQEVYQLKISGISLEQKGKNLTIDQPVEHSLKNGETSTIALYKFENGLRVFVEFTPVFKGRRMKLKRNIFVETPEGRQVKSRQKKAVELLKVSVSGNMKGRDAVSLLYDRKQRKSIFIKYDYNLIYN